MGGNKTVQSLGDVSAFLNSVEDPKRRADADSVIAIMQGITGWKPAMWGTSIIGFGSYDYKYESGRTGSSMVVGLSPRKAALTLYIMPGFSAYDEMLAKLGSHKTGKSCLYIKRLSDIDLDVLRALVKASVETMKQRYTCKAS